jgi:hypothetical protein
VRRGYAKTGDPQDYDPRPCPKCGGETENEEIDGDEDGSYKVTAPCDDCAARCKNCGDKDCAKVEETGYCEECAPLARVCECGAVLEEGTADFDFCVNCR